ncbi:MAG: T9SS type A sorting domain-containing protein [Bacteroidales bacterium]|nr:T9SS type A sorting domain-containing protein [Bacteroidales bacterium]MCF8398535.1 T9SS type A sorting domain-containing protein [Bacteroidales bacterium]
MEKFEVNCYITTQVENVYDYEKFWLYAVFENPNGQNDTVDGFYFQQYEMTAPNQIEALGDPYWKIRYTPEVTGTYQFSLVCTDTSGTAQEPPMEFTCTASDHKGFVRNTDGRQVFYDDGDIFISLGQNIAWDGFEQDFYHYKPYTDSMEKYDANMVRLYMTPWSYGIEWSETGLGQYTERLSNAWKLDWIMDQFNEKDILCSLVLCIHDELIYSSNSNNHWQDNPYNDDNGGPCPEPQDFYINETARELFKRKLRYINARWGYSDNILEYEILSEADNFPYYQEEKADIRNWIVEMASYMKGIDPNDHFTTASYAVAEHDSLLWLDPAIDIAHVHVYLPQDGDLTLSLYDKLRNYFSAFDKAIIAGEAGLFHLEDTLVLKDPMGITFHNALWVSHFAGSFSSALYWHWPGYINELKLYPHYAAVKAFFNNDDFYYEDPQPAEIFCYSDSVMNVRIIPKYFSISMPAEHDTFEVQQSGRLRPLNLFLSEVLYGTDPVGQNLRNPPVFSCDYIQEGFISIHTGAFVNNAILSVSIDGQVVFEEMVEQESVYTLAVDSGKHDIMVQNSGDEFGSYLEVEQYVFKNYAPVLRAFVLKDQGSVRGWLQNRRYSWQHWFNNGNEPLPLNHACLEIIDVPEGTYTVSWWNTASGAIDSVIQVNTIGTRLRLEVDDVLWDKAFKADLVVGTSSFERTTPGIHVYPNPFRENVNISVYSQKQQKAMIKIFDLKGRSLCDRSVQLQHGNNLIRLAELKHCKNAVYLLEIDLEDGSHVLKLMKSK